MSVRKRKWTTSSGEKREAWIVDYVDEKGRHIETFRLKKEADEREAAVRVNVGAGTHTSPNQSITIADAARNWISFVELEGRERATVAQYRQHVDIHIAPRIGREKLAKLTTPRTQAFRDELLRSLSRAQAKKVLTSLKSLLKDAKRRGNVAQNVAADVAISKDRRASSKLKIGEDIPAPGEIKAILGHLPAAWRALLTTAIFTGLRSSELRGLRWKDVDLKKGEIHVRQRADRYNEIDKPKSESGERTIPLPPHLLSVLKEWKLARPGELVFANGIGKLENHANIINRGLVPAQIAAGVTVPALGDDGKPKTDGEGKPVLTAKYTGLHALRHFYASWCINRREDGGLGLPPKVVQERMGHATIMMTMDVYGHLFPRTDDGKEMVEAERFLLG